MLLVNTASQYIYVYIYSTRLGNICASVLELLKGSWDMRSQKQFQNGNYKQF